MDPLHDTEDVKQAIRYLGQAVAESSFKQTIDQAVMQWMRYRLNRKLPDLPMPDVNELLKGTQMLETNIDQWKAKAVAEGVLLGEQKGLVLGKLEGEAVLLERLLSKRFGSLPDPLRARLKAATAEQLESWADRVLDAPSLDAVFGHH